MTCPVSLMAGRCPGRLQINSAGFGAARVPSSDARYGHPVLRSLGADFALGILPSLVSYAVSGTRATPNRSNVVLAFYEARGASFPAGEQVPHTEARGAGFPADCFAEVPEARGANFPAGVCWKCPEARGASREGCWGGSKPTECVTKTRRRNVLWQRDVGSRHDRQLPSRLATRASGFFATQPAGEPAPRASVEPRVDVAASQLSDARG